MYPDKLDGGFFYTALVLAGEVGELLNKIKENCQR
jgi:NTP pyrophosphatase (non-canonical NTP hydrolase)